MSHFVDPDKREDKSSPKPWEQPHRKYHTPLSPPGWKASTPLFLTEHRHAEGNGKHHCSGSDLRCPQRPQTPPLCVLYSPKRYDEHKSCSPSPRLDKCKGKTKSWSKSDSSSSGEWLPSPKCRSDEHSSKHHELKYREGHEQLTSSHSSSTVEPSVELTYCGASPPTGKTPKSKDELDCDFPVMLWTPLGPLAFTPEALKSWGCAHLDNSK